MSYILVTLLYIIFVVGINGAWLKESGSTNEDAIELTELIVKLWSLKPDVMKRARPLVYCRIINECCDDEERSEAISLMGQVIHGTPEYHFAEIMLTCINSTTANQANELCSSIVDSIISMRMASKYSNMKKYFDITNKYDKELNNLVNYILSTCNSEEIHAFFCLSNKKLMEICSGRVLQTIYDDDYKNYQETITNTKQILINLNQQLSRAFIKNNNVE